MGRKVFISFLGTGSYQATYYTHGTFKSQYTRYIQCALCDLLGCDKWDENDRILIFCTEQSKETHWGALYKALCEQGLEKIVEKDVKTIKLGFDEAEIWEIFSIICSYIQDGDHIYFDSTHAFRSIPLFSSTLFNYTQFTKHTVVEGIYYGAFEKIRNDHPGILKIEDIPQEERVAPIVNMSSITRLQEYTTMAGNLSNFGRMKGIGKAISSGNASDQNIKRVADSIELLDGYIATNQEPNIKEGVYKSHFDKNIKTVLMSDSIAQPLKDIITILKDELSEFRGEESLENVEAAINWAFKYDMMAQAYTMGLEYLITLGVIIIGERNPFYNAPKKDCRGFVSSLLSIKRDKETKKYKLDGYLANGNEIVSMELLNDDFIKSVKKTFGIINDERIEIDHAKGKRKYDEYKTSFAKNFPYCVNLLKKEIERLNATQANNDK